MKRIIIIIFVLAFIFALVTVPALADSVDSVGEVHPNILDQFSYFNWSTDQYDYDSNIPSVTYSGDEVNYITLEVEGITSSFPVDVFTLSFTCSSFIEFEDILIIFSGPYGAEHISADINSFNDTTDNLNLYSVSFDIGSVIQGNFQLEFTFTGPISHFTINLLSLFTNFGSNSVLVDNANVSFNGTMQAQGEGFYDQSFYEGYVQFPYTFSLGLEAAAAPYDRWMEVYMEIPGNLVTNCNQLVITFITTGLYDNVYDHNQLSYGGISLIGRDIINIPTNAYYSLMNSSWEGMDVWRVSVVADLSGYDLDLYNIGFSTMFQPAFPNPSSPGYCSYFFRFESVNFYLQSPYDLPWYSTFYHWIEGLIWELNANINQNFSFLSQKLDRYFGINETVPNYGDKQESMQDSVDDMESVSDDIENSRNELEELMPSMPTWEQTGLDQLAGDYGANIAPILVIYNAIYENIIIVQILTFTMLFALGGFILFGER